MEKRKFLFISEDGLSADTAWQVQKEGHDVLMSIDNKAEGDVADGFVKKVDKWKDHVEWSDVVVFDDVLGCGEKANKLRKAGKAVIGGTAYSDRLEDDRAFGQDELKRHGISILPYELFTDFDKAIDYVKNKYGKDFQAYILPSGNTVVPQLI